MRRHNFITVLVLVSFLVTLFFVKSAIANYLKSGTSGTIAGTSLAYTDLSFTDRFFSVKIRNNGMAVNFSSKVSIISSNNTVLMQSDTISGIIPASGVTTFTDTYPIIQYLPEQGIMYQVKWLDLIVTPVN